MIVAIDPTSSSNLKKEDILKDVKILNKKDESTFTLVYEHDIPFTVNGVTTHIDYIEFS